jgi:hypothetical protein
VSNSYFTENIVAMRKNNLKLIIGKDVGDNRILAWPELSPTPVKYGLTGGLIEQGTDHCRSGNTKADKGKGPDCSAGCLYDLVADAAETHNLINDPKYKDDIGAMKKRLREAAAAAPPKSQYWSEPEPYDRKLAAICDASIKTTFLEPVE